MSNAGLNSRLAAHSLLMAVLKQKKTLEFAMDELPELAPQDRALAYRLAKTCLRYKLAMDALLKKYLQKQMQESRLDITCCLYMGVAQILLLDTPPHAAVNTTVDVAKRFFPKLSGLVNAICKKIAADKEAIQLKPEDAMPPWLWEHWVDDYGKEQALAIAAAHVGEPPLDVTWVQPIAEGEVMPGGSIRLPKGSDFASLEGNGWVQDIAASLPVKLLGDIKGKRVLDACAAPGGKTMQLAIAGAQVTALDISENRLNRLRENLEYNNLEAEVICADLRKWQPDEKFDIIVLDAPCSATGTIRRHPEIMHQRQPEDVNRLVEIQQTLLAKALQWLKPDGKLLYITCSLQPEEGENQMQLHIKRVQPLEASVAGIPDEWISPQGYLRTTPAMLGDKGGMDGFFAAMLKA
ncbi:MAG: transcription antitermination factor NusB [Rickettsiales bacterium]|nr:transcription antitermination factor NusB [Rickettsiales bacterium]